MTGGLGMASKAAADGAAAFAIDANGDLPALNKRRSVVQVQRDGDIVQKRQSAQTVLLGVVVQRFAVHHGVAVQVCRNFGGSMTHLVSDRQILD